ncbi:CRAL_TRIO domain-containing protein/CRAL_TRIO_N domain-containing protein, partial [Cephalotus follicularis]
SLNMADNTIPPPAPTEIEYPPPTAAPESDPPAVTQKEEPPASEAVASEPPSAEKEVASAPAPAAPAAESKSLAAMMEKEEAKSEVKEKSVATQEGVSVVDVEERKVPQNSISFKEESSKVADLSDLERKALEELKQFLQEALNTRQFTTPPPPPTSPDEFSIWGIPLLNHDCSDVILLKFLRARDFNVWDAFTMIKKTIQWRKEFNIDGLVDEDFGEDLEKVVFMHGHDREGHPVCYNVYGEFQNKELYQKTFSDEEKRMKFLRWRIQFLERSIRQLDFSPGGICTILQVNDLKNSPGPGKRELRLATKQGLQLLQDNYPEFVAKQVFINVPWWYIAFYTMMSPFMTQRTKSKFVFAGPTKSAETLFKYISPEQVPIQYGGLSVDYCHCNPEFSIADPVTEITVKPATKQTVEIIIYERCIIVWELRVVGWEVSYGAEFVPDDKDAYTVIINKPTKMAPTDEPMVSNSFKVGELGKILLTFDNSTSKKKKLLYRFKIKPFCD